MNLYKALSDDYRSYQLRETEKLVKSKKRIDSKMLKESVKAKEAVRLKKLKESVNVNVNSDDGNVNVSVDGSNVNVNATSTCNDVVCEEPIVEPEVKEVEPEVEEVVSDEVTEEVPEMDPVEPEDGEEELKENSDEIKAFWDKGFKVGDKVNTSGAGEVEILDLNEGSDYILVKRPTDSVEFVAAWAPEFDGEKLSWGQGHYFDNEEDAREYFDSKVKGLDEADVVPKNSDKEDIKDQGCTNNIQDSEDFKECEVRSFRITRISPSSGIYMIEADNSKNERSYIVGKNFDNKTKTLDEAEMFTDRSKANNKFKEMLVNSNKKGE